MFNDIDPRELALRLPVVFFSLTIHEFMHAWTAWKCGDETALRLGRVSLNPMRHLDLVGTLCLVFAPIGWAKPVPVNPYNFNHPRRDEILVSGAGVAANLAVAIVLAIVLRLLFHYRMFPTGEVGQAVLMMAFMGMIINFGLFVFNLLPIPPLDGSHILGELLPVEAKARFAEIGQYGMWILVAFILINRQVHFSFLGYSHVSPMSAPIILLMQVFAGPEITSFFFE
jgi:Zn-dependent protease